MNLLLNGEQSERLLFRKLVQADFDQWLPFHQEPLSTKYWEGLDTNPNIACANWFKAVFSRYENQLGGMNALILKETGALVGQCGLLVQTVDDVSELEIGYSILPNYWKQGFATEAAMQCKHFAFSKNVTKSLISIIHIDNTPSQKVALNNGMFLDKTTMYKSNPVHIYRTYA